MEGIVTVTDIDRAACTVTIKGPKGGGEPSAVSGSSAQLAPKGGNPGGEMAKVVQVSAVVAGRWAPRAGWRDGRPGGPRFSRP